MIRAAILAMCGACAAHSAGAAIPASKTFDVSAYSQRITACDRLASHPEDPNKVVAGLETSEMDLPTAIEVCEQAVAKDPKNPRLHYQLGRALTYAGKVNEALPHLDTAATAKYPQALFVVGYLYAEGYAGVRKDACKAATYIRESGVYGRVAGLLALPAYAIEGRFKGCESAPDAAEIAAFLAAAKAKKPGYYADLLIDALERQSAR